MTRVNITNAPPYILNMSVSSPINLMPNGTVLVTCNASIMDYNGFQDIYNVSATFYAYSISKSSFVDHNRTHYSNSTCVNVSSYDIVSNYSCSFEVYYFADNGTWTCNMTVVDIPNIQATGIANSTINNLIALTVPDLIDYGQVPVSNTSANVMANLTNVGNKAINITMVAYALNISDGLALKCEQGNISFDSQRYSLFANTTFTSRIIANNTNLSRIAGLTIAQRNNSLSDALNTTNWMLTVPVGPQGTPYGLCNGTVVFNAMQASQ